MMGFVIALVSGALMSIQGVFNTEVTKQTSIWVSAGWVQLTAFGACLAMWLFTGRGQIGGLWQVEPKYMLTGGILGALITYTVIKSVGSLGPAQSALLIGGCPRFLWPMGLKYLTVRHRADRFEWRKLLGAAVAILGIIIFEK